MIEDRAGSGLIGKPGAVFQFGKHKVRTAGTLERPLFCAVDVCGALGHSNSSAAISRLDTDEKESVSIAYPPHGMRETAFVTESGLFSLILTSRKDEARAFKRWVTGEVLPAIRRTGVYDAVKEQQHKQTALLLEQIFPHAPTSAKPIFTELIGALVKMRGQKESANPPWARLLAKLVYGWSTGIDGEQRKRRELNPKPGKAKQDHSMFSEELSEATKRVLRAGADMAKVAVDWNDWRTKMDLVFEERPLQLPFPNLKLLKGGKRGK